MRSTHYRRGSGVVFLSILIGFCGLAAGTTAAGEAIQIGQLADLTGFLSELGADAKKGVEFRLDEVGWKVAGKPVGLLVEDTATDTATTLDKAKKLVERDGVDILIGPLSSADAMALAPYCRDRKIFDISVGSHPPEIADFGWTVQITGGLAQTTYPMGEYASKKMQFRTASSIAWDYVAGYIFQEGFKKGFESGGGQVVQEQWVPMGAPDFSSFLARLKEADLTIIWLSDPDLTRLLGQYVELGLLDRTPIHQTRAETVYWKTPPEFADKYLGLTGAGHYAWTLDNPINKKFVAAYEKRYGEKPSTYAETAYESASLALAVFEATRGQVAPEELRKAMVGLRLETPTGPVTIGSDLVATRNFYILELNYIEEAGVYEYKAIDVYRQFRLPTDK